MQWFLQQVIGIASAADIEEDYGHYFSDPDINSIDCLEKAADETLHSLLETSDHQPENKTKYVRDYMYGNQLATASVR
jgi:hypothetical protein